VLRFPIIMKEVVSMKTTVTHGDSLVTVRQHQETGWRLGADCDADYREFKIVADDLRTLAGRTGYPRVREANRLCRELLPVAAHRLDVLGMHIGFWQKTVRERYGDATLERLKDIMAERHPKGCPTVGDAKAAAKTLRKCSDNYTEEMILGEVFQNRDFAASLGNVMTRSAFVIDMAIEWLAILIRSICECNDEEEAYEAL